MFGSYFTNRPDFEWQILEFFNNIANSFFNLLFMLISEFGAGEIVFGIVIFIYYLYDKNLAKKIMIALSTSLVFNGIFKSLFMAKRPFQFEDKGYLKKFQNSSDGATGSSFPSGHSQNAGAFFTSIFMNFKKKWIKIFSICMAILVPISRLYLGVHFPGDVVIGLILGISIAIIMNLVYPKLENKIVYLGYSIGMVVLCIPFIIINWNNALVADFFKSTGLFISVVLSFYIEKKYINFSTKPSLKEAIIRLVVVLVVVFGIKIGVKYILPNHNICHLIRYFLMGFSALGILPFFFSKEGVKDVQSN